MFKLLSAITLLLVSAYYLKEIAGIDVLAKLIVLPLEELTHYREPLDGNGFHNLQDMENFSKLLSPFFTAITSTGFDYDRDGWQIARFEIVPLPSGTSEGLPEAVSITARNYLRTAHGIDNADIFVTLLGGNCLWLKIACSPKAKKQAQALNFSPLPQNNAPLEEDIKIFQSTGKKEGEE